MMLKMNSILPKCTLTGIFFVNLFIVITCLYRTDTFIASTGTRRQPVFKTTTSKSILSCCSVCALQTECYAMNFNDETNTCELVDIPATATEENLDGNWITYIRDEWMLMFRGTAGIGVDMYDAWVDGSNAVTHDDVCMDLSETSCGNHYRHTNVTDWSRLGITQVRFSIYEDGEEKQYIIFNGSGSDSNSWFQSDKIIETSWANLSTDTFNDFSINGYAPSRRFYINRNHGGCESDRHYLVVINSNHFSCSYDQLPPYPAILYAEGTASAAFETDNDVGQADFIAISVKLT